MMEPRAKIKKDGRPIAVLGYEILLKIF